MTNSVNTVSTVGGCITKFIGPTNHRWHRVGVKHMATVERKIVEWDDNLNEKDNHEAAARLILGNGPLLSCSYETGWVWLRAE